VERGLLLRLAFAPEELEGLAMTALFATVNYGIDYWLKRLKA
jgi:hypothetical protein